MVSHARSESAGKAEANAKHSILGGSQHQSQQIFSLPTDQQVCLKRMACKARTIVVAGATNGQGASVVDALRSTSKAKIRAITRDATSERAKALASKGVDIVQADLGDPDTLTKAFQDASDLFLVIPYTITAEATIQMGKNAVDAAKEAGIQNVVFSTLEKIPNDVKDALPAVEKDMIIPSYEGKAAIADYLKETGLNYTLLLASSFYDNMYHFTVYQKDPDGSYTFSYNLGTAPHAWQARADIGPVAAAVLAEPEIYKGQTIPVVAQHTSYPEIAETISAVTGRTVKYVPVTYEQYAALPFPFARELANMLAYTSQYPYYDELRPLDKCITKGTPFKDWAEAHREDLIKRMDAGCPQAPDS